MPAYKAPLRDFDFVLNELIKVQDIIPQLPGYEEATQDIFTSYLEAAQFCESELAPLNRQADEEGCQFDPSTKAVTTRLASRKPTSNIASWAFRRWTVTRPMAARHAQIAGFPGDGNAVFVQCGLVDVSRPVAWRVCRHSRPRH
jgi:hypothetical protein